MSKKLRLEEHKKLALIGAALAAPIGVLWSTIVFKITPLERVLKMILTNDGDRPSAFGMAFMAAGILVLPIALMIALWPMLRGAIKGKTQFYLLNIVVAAVILILIYNTWWQLIEEIYRCDVLKTPNCD